MRLASFQLECYGAIEKRRFDFGDGQGLFIIHGPNEAGKSTALAAVTDFLFGIPLRSPHGGQVFRYQAMRLDARLLLANGRHLDITRRKKKGGHDLTDGDGKGLDETQLARLLGPTNRDRFTSLFGLDHEALRTGGERMLQAEGDIGRLILEAGGGLRPLVTALDRLNEQAEGMFTPHRAANRLFYQKSDAFKAAEQKARSTLVNQDAVKKADIRITEAKTALDAHRAHLKTLRQQQFHEQRVERIAPLMAQLTRTQAALKAFDDLPPALDRSFARDVEDAQEKAKAAQSSFEEAVRAQTALIARAEAEPVASGLAALATDIERVALLATHVAKEQAERPRRLDELTEQQGKLALLKAQLGLGPDDDLAARLPGPDAVAELRRLARAADTLDMRRAALDTGRMEDEAARAILDQRMAARHAAGTDQPFGLSSGTFAGLPQQVRMADEKSAEVEQESRTLTKQASPCGSADLDTLAALILPDLETVQAEIDWRNQLAEQSLRLTEKAGEARTAYDRAEAEAAHLAAGPEAPTDTAIKTARQTRDEIWTALKDDYLADTSPPTPPDIRRERAELLTQATAMADDLGDRRGIEADRLARLKAAKQEQMVATAELEATEKTLADLAQSKRKREQVWAATWPEAVTLEADPERLKVLIARRLDLLAKAVDLDRRSREAASLRKHAMAEHARFEDVEQRLGFDPGALDLAERIRRTQAAITSHDDAYSDHRADLKADEDLKQHRHRRAGEAQTLEREEAAWRADWPRALAAVGVTQPAAALPPAQAIEIADQWATAPGILDAVQLTQRQLNRMADDFKTLSTQVADMRARLGNDSSLPVDPLAAAGLLQTRLETAKTAASKHAALEGERTTRTTEVARWRRALETTEKTLTALARDAGVAIKDLGPLAARHGEWLSAKDTARQLEDKIIAAGDGRSLETLWQDWRGRDLDDVRSDLAAITDEIHNLEDGVAQGQREIAEADRARNELGGSDLMLTAIAEREAATADLHDTVERYLTIKLAQDLLSAGIEHLRGEIQDPLLARAGEIFAQATCGAFASIATTLNEKNEPVVAGQRAAGHTVSVTEMSSGTRDQLFLAFRIAYIEHYCASVEPLPFLADDLLVHFDDQRAAATLDLLAMLGTTTQVLLFTHHDSVRSAGAKLATEGRATIVEMI